MSSLRQQVQLVRNKCKLLSAIKTYRSQRVLIANGNKIISLLNSAHVTDLFFVTSSWQYLQLTRTSIQHDQYLYSEYLVSMSEGKIIILKTYLVRSGDKTPYVSIVVVPKANSGVKRQRSGSEIVSMKMM